MAIANRKATNFPLYMLSLMDDGRIRSLADMLIAFCRCVSVYPGVSRSSRIITPSMISPSEMLPSVGGVTVPFWAA